MFPGIGGMNPKDLQKAMKKLGVRQEEIPAKEVIIKTNDKNLVIKNPHVVKINMMGQESLQITGDIKEESAGTGETKPVIAEEDILLVMDQANVTKEKALEALEKSCGDLSKAIISLQNK